MAEKKDSAHSKDSGSGSHKTSPESDSSQPPDDSFLFETKYIVLSFLHHLTRERPEVFFTSQASLSSSSSDPRVRLYAYKWKTASLPGSPPHKLRSKRVKKRDLAGQSRKTKSEENLTRQKPPRPRSAKKSKCDQCRKTRRDEKVSGAARGCSLPLLARSLSRSYDDIQYLRSVSSSSNGNDYQSDADDELDTSVDSAKSFGSTFSNSKEFRLLPVSRDLRSPSHRLSTVVSESELEAEHRLSEQKVDGDSFSLLPDDFGLLQGVRDLETASCLSSGLPTSPQQVLDLSSVALQFDEQPSSPSEAFPFPPHQSEDEVWFPSTLEEPQFAANGSESLALEVSQQDEEVVSKTFHPQSAQPPSAELLEREADNEDSSDGESDENLRSSNFSDFLSSGAVMQSSPRHPKRLQVLDAPQDSTEYCTCDVVSAADAGELKETSDVNEAESKDSLDVVDSKDDMRTGDEVSDDRMDDTVDGGQMAAGACSDLDLGDQVEAAWLGSGDRSRLFLDLGMQGPEQLVATFQEEVEDEMVTLESEIEDVLRSQHLPRGATAVPMTPQTEVARILASIGDDIMQEHEHRLNMAVSTLFSSSGGPLSYSGFLDTARHLVNCHLPGWRQVALLMVYSQQVAFEALRFGRQGVGDLTDYTVAMLADLAADFIVNQGGWSSIACLEPGMSSSTSYSDLDVRGDPHHSHLHHASLRNPRHSNLSASARGLPSHNSTGNLIALEHPTLTAVRGLRSHASLNHLDRRDRFSQSCRDLSSRKAPSHSSSHRRLSHSSRDLHCGDRSDGAKLASTRRSSGNVGANRGSKEQEVDSLDVDHKGETHAVSSHVLSSHTYDNLTRHRHTWEHHHGHHRSLSQEANSLRSVVLLSPDPHCSPSAQHLSRSGGSNQKSSDVNSSPKPKANSDSKKEESSGEVTSNEPDCERSGLLQSKKLILSTAVLAAGMGMALILWKRAIS